MYTLLSRSLKKIVKFSSMENAYLIEEVKDGRKYLENRNI